MNDRPYDSIEFWQELAKENPTTRKNVLRHLAKTDLWFLCYYVLGWEFYNHPYARWFCGKVQDDPWQLWLVARGHLKSLTITCAHTIQCILNDPEKSTMIFSYILPMAKKFLSQIKFILETNEKLKELFPDILYARPDKESPKWTEDAITVKRKTTRKEATVEVSGLVEGMRTGMHVDYMKYDDIVVPASVTTPEMIAKTTEAWRMSGHLGMKTSPTKKAYCGTRYHYYDTYSVMIASGTIPTKLIPATHNGQMDGNPIFMSREDLEKELAENGIYVFSSQMLLNPISDKDKKFRQEWLQYYDELPKGLRLYLVGDPANAKKKKSDWTAFGVLGMDSDGNTYLIDAIHDKLDLSERFTHYYALYDRWHPHICGYEKYGMQADLEYFRLEATRIGRTPLPIYELGGQLSKADRILRLVPDMQAGRFFLPRTLVKWCSYDDKNIDIVQRIIMELNDFPMGQHDDLIDMLSRIFDLRPIIPNAPLTEEQKSFENYLKEKQRGQKRLDFSNNLSQNRKRKEWWQK